MMFKAACALLLAAAPLSSAFSVSPSQLHTSVSSNNGNNGNNNGPVKNTPFQQRNQQPLFMADSTETVSIDEISEELRQHKVDFDEKMSSTTTVAEAEAIRVEYLGKKGPINKVMSYMRLLPNDDKPKLGAVVNEIKSELEAVVVERKDEMKVLEIQTEMEKEVIDVTLPGLSTSENVGKRHPLSMTMEKAVDIFTSLGYDTVTDCDESPEIETDYMCFEALNCPKDHPARDMQDTFYLTQDMGQMLRTHTSAVQIRQMQKRDPPMRIVAPGRVYRKDDIDATHSMIFHQIEILALDERGKLNLGHLKGTVEHFLREMFGPNIEVRFRGSYFPFTEPSMEVDVFFRGKWLEVLGCGMVDPNVLEMAGIDSTKVSGFAAGFGVERFAMVIHDINDIREFYKNDKRFLEQFPSFYDQGLVTMKEGVKNDPVPVAKKEKPKKAAKKTPPAQPSATIDVSKLDIRVGVITKAWLHEEADKLFCEEIDIGEESGPRNIASGLRAHYNLEDLEGQRVLVLANLKTRKMLGFPSHGMVLCAATEDGSKVEFIEPPSDAKIGERVLCEGFEGEPVSAPILLRMPIFFIYKVLTFCVLQHILEIGYRESSNQEENAQCNLS
jgi:phenylalanyl-tRNA synthetase alpha chain